MCYGQFNMEYCRFHGNVNSLFALLQMHVIIVVGFVGFVWMNAFFCVHPLCILNWYTFKCDVSGLDCLLSYIFETDIDKMERIKNYLYHF